jgi:hypothetical protein
VALFGQTLFNFACMVRFVKLDTEIGWSLTAAVGNTHGDIGIAGNPDHLLRMDLNLCKLSSGMVLLGH